jgi:threonine dehydrogenase-like Zn-dependent dehydrogenase
MRAVTCHAGSLELYELPDPVPGPGQIVLEVVRCGICGSDLHARHHADEAADVMAEAGYPDLMRSDQRVVMGHEFSGRVAEHGPRTSRRGLPEGTPVVSLPLLRREGGPHGIGLSVHAPGAYAERVLVEAALTLPVPNGLGTEIAALTEPLAVGHHAVRRSEISPAEVAIVVGCGPIGLAVILMLRARGVRRILACDPSPARRALALRCGAETVLDPAEGSPLEATADPRHLRTFPAAAELALQSVERLRRLPLPWHHLWRAAERLGAATPPRPVIFECVGIPGMIDGLMAAAPMFSRLVVVGVCMGPDRIRPTMAINKEIDLRFVIAYTPLEFRDTLQMLAEGRVDPRPMVTGTVGLGGVAEAFETLSDPERHAKILVDPAAA